MLNFADESVQPGALPVAPEVTLFERAREWLRTNLSVIDDPSRQCNKWRPVGAYFPGERTRSFEDIDILVIGAESTQRCDLYTS